jgi:glycosyltransferase involved in cell wall biosynthesis
MPIPKLSVVILTKNEEANIRACLETVKGADEIVIVDDESADKTLEICRAYTEKIFIRKLDGFGQQRAYATDKATGPWVLFLDADERLSPSLFDEIRQAVSNPSGFVAYEILRRTFFLGRPITHCGWSMASTRLFLKGRAKWTERLVHEEVVADGPLGALKTSYEHHSYRSIAHYLEKLDRYTTLEALDQFKKGRRIKRGTLLLAWGVKPMIAFFRKWVLMGGILDGARGFLISVFTAMAVFFNFVKLWELQESEKRKEKGEKQRVR